jgi:hypothetical protein
MRFPSKKGHLYPAQFMLRIFPNVRLIVLFSRRETYDLVLTLNDHYQLDRHIAIFERRLLSHRSFRILALIPRLDEKEVPMCVVKSHLRHRRQGIHCDGYYFYVFIDK